MSLSYQEPGGVVSYGMLAAIFEAPLQASSRRWPKLIHAVDVDAIGDFFVHSRKTMTAVCGARQVRLVVMLRQVGDEQVPGGAPWPPRVKGMPEQRERCRECWVATGKPCPRTEWNRIRNQR